MSAARWMLVAGGLLGALGVAAGAFGAHALDGRLDARDMAIFETAVRYQMYHALALLACAAMATTSLDGRALRVAAAMFAGGTLFFSGSLYVLVATGVRALGAVTPIGGTLWIVGWIALVVAAVRGRVNTTSA